MTLASCKENEGKIMIKTALEKCFYSAGYNVNEDVLSVVIESIHDELPELTLDEFISKLRYFRRSNKERISVPLILQIFKPKKHESEYQVISSYI